MDRQFEEEGIVISFQLTPPSVEYAPLSVPDAIATNVLSP
jgi:hypothetical protein